MKQAEVFLTNPLEFRAVGSGKEIIG